MRSATRICAASAASPIGFLILLIEGGRQKDRKVGRPILCANPSAQFEAVDFGHDPVGDEQGERLVSAQQIPGLSTVDRADDIVPQVRDATLDDPEFGQIGFDD